MIMINSSRMGGPTCAPCAPCGPAFTTRRPITGTYTSSPGWFGARRVVPGYSNFSRGWDMGGGCSSYYRPTVYRPSYYTSWSTPVYTPAYHVRSNPAADAAITVGVGALALGVLLSL